MSGRSPTTIRRSVLPLGALVWVLGVTGCGQKADGSAGISAVSGVGLDAAAAREREQAPGLTLESIAERLERDMVDFQALRERSHAATNETFADPAAMHEPVRGPEVVEFTYPSVTAPSTGDRLRENPVEHDMSPVRPDWDRDDPFGRGGAPMEFDPPPVATTEVMPPEVRLGEAMVELRRVLYQNASYADSPLREYLAIAALAMVDPDRALDPDVLYDLSESERELLRAYQNHFLHIGEELMAQSDEATLIALIDELRRDVTNQGPLKIARAELCTRVDGFGRIAAFDKNAFLAGSGQDAVVYAEIDGFTSEQNEQGLWVTDLWQELVIYSAHDGVPVWHQDWRAAPDVASRRRTDFFISYIITIPDRLTVGQYTLKIRVRDEKTHAIAETGIEFRIVADPTLAGTVPD